MKVSTKVLKNKLVKQGSDKDFMLVSLSDDSVLENSVFRQKMNVALVIDLSGSMDRKVKTKEDDEYLLKISERQKKIFEYMQKNQPVQVNININQPYIDPWIHGYGFDNARININQRDLRSVDLPAELKSHIEAPQSKTQLMLAKEAAKSAVESLQDGDILSIVTFASLARVAVPNTIITRDNKDAILRKIDSFQTEGSTNLYDGWYMGAKQVAENINEKQVNRVIVLTDGEATHGFRTSEDFCPKVADIFDVGISTSTIGFGDQFNEEMLESISVAGNGNFYYGRVDDDLGGIFDLEFKDMKNTLAQKIEVSFELVDGVQIKNESVVVRELSRNVFAIPNLKAGMNRSAIFSLMFKSELTSSLENDKLFGNVIVKYVDKDGQEKEVKSSLKFDVVSSEDFEKESENKEIKVQKALIEIAEQQKKAMQELSRGNVTSARAMMSDAVTLSASYGIADERLVGSSTVMLNSIRSIDKGESLDSLKKSVHYAKYKTERGDAK